MSFEIKKGILIRYTEEDGVVDVVIPDDVGAILDEAFKGCTSLQSVTIPDNVTMIGAGAFEGCTSLQSVTIPADVGSISWRSFKGCTSLQSVTISDNMFKDNKNDPYSGYTHSLWI